MPEQIADSFKEYHILRGWPWRLMGWAVAIFLLGSIGYAIIVLIVGLLESGAL